MPQPELQNSMRMGKVTRNSFRGVVAEHVVAEHVPEVSSCDRQTLAGGGFVVLAEHVPDRVTLHKVPPIRLPRGHSLCALRNPPPRIGVIICGAMADFQRDIQ